ncbi:MAG TPA: phospholipase D family protein [Polyangiaceae bacterium]|nr:phospholipase D family protein [Polyangiaceae bacterium]
MAELVSDAQHHDEVLLRALREARVSLWIASANLKDIRLEAPIGTRARARGRYVSVTEFLQELVSRGVDVRILHADKMSGPFARSLGELRGMPSAGFEVRACPRVHLKLIIVDGRFLYLGSANFTGAGLGARAEGRRNFELGVVTDDHLLLDAVQLRFDRIWTGQDCGACRLRANCPKPLDGLQTPRRLRDRAR